jgi:hypothetical protein
MKSRKILGRRGRGRYFWSEAADVGIDDSLMVPPGAETGSRFRIDVGERRQQYIAVRDLHHIQIRSSGEQRIERAATHLRRSAQYHRAYAAPAPAQIPR